MLLKSLIFMKGSKTKLSLLDCSQFSDTSSINMVSTVFYGKHKLQFLNIHTSINMENLFLTSKEFECAICFDFMKSPKNPIQVACPSQHIICIECFDRVFEVTEISDENKSVGKCFCRGEVIIEDCISAKSFERIINNLFIKCPNYTNGCKWKCDVNDIDFSRIRNEHLEHCW